MNFVKRQNVRQNLKCAHGGSCKFKPEKTGMFCDCLDGFGGDFCEINYNVDVS